MATVLVVDDHALVRHAISHLVQSRSDLELCGVAADSVEAKQLLTDHDPDLVILDLFLKDSRAEGLKLARRDRQRVSSNCRARFVDA